MTGDHITAIGCEPCEPGYLVGIPLTYSVQEMVRAFHKKFGILAPDAFTIPSRGRMFARLNWIWEETDELHKAINDDNVVEVLDALADIIYFCYGMAVEMGVDLDPVIAEVQRSNLAKEGGNTRLDGKLLKPQGWKPPDIPSVLEAQGVLRSAYGHPRDRKPTTARASACDEKGCGCDIDGNHQCEGKDISPLQSGR